MSKYQSWLQLFLLGPWFELLFWSVHRFMLCFVLVVVCLFVCFIACLFACLFVLFFSSNPNSCFFKALIYILSLFSAHVNYSILFSFLHQFRLFIWKCSSITYASWITEHLTPWKALIQATQVSVYATWLNRVWNRKIRFGWIFSE